MSAGTEIIKNKSAAYRMLIIEASLVVVLALLIYFFASLESAYSVLLGGLAFIVPNSVFVWFSFRKSTGSSSNKALAWFYIGEALKVFSTIALFTGSILLVANLNIGLMFVSYGVVLLINLTGLAITMNN